VNFTDTTFYEKVDFSRARFHNPAFFVRTKFCSESDFSDVEFNGVSFSEDKFLSEAFFVRTKFLDKTSFSNAKFSTGAYFLDCKFNSETKFSYVSFDEGDKVIFDVRDLSKVSFMNTDITRLKFGENVMWGTNQKDQFVINDERKLERSLKHSRSLEYIFGAIDISINRSWDKIKLDDDGSFDIAYDAKESTITVTRRDYSAVYNVVRTGRKIFIYPAKQVRLGSIKALYRNLRENYEYRLRYDEAGEFFIREMELKRKYREVVSEDGRSVIVEANGWLGRHLSLTGLYYHFSNYGESIAKPAKIGAITVGISTLFWLIQNSPTDDPFLPFITAQHLHDHKIVSNYINITQVLNNTHLLKAFERSFSDLIPLLPQGSNINVGIIDYIVKIFGGALTFGFLAVALRRRFERKYRH
jgi:pentapeptide repeat protein